MSESICSIGRADVNIANIYGLTPFVCLRGRGVRAALQVAPVTLTSNEKVGSAGTDEGSAGPWRRSKCKASQETLVSTDVLQRTRVDPSRGVYHIRGAPPWQPMSMQMRLLVRMRRGIPGGSLSDDGGTHR